MIFIFLLHVLLPGTGNVFEGVEDGEEVGEGLASSVVGIDDDTEVLEVVLESDGEGLCLYESGFLEVIIVKEGDDFLLERVVDELGFLGFGDQVVLACVFVGLH